MPQNIILAAGQTALNATDVTIGVGGSATFSIRSATAGQPIPRNIGIPIQLVVGATVRNKATLTFIEDTIQMSAPGVWRCARGDISAHGVDIEILVDA